MKKEEFREVLWARHEMYTLDEIFEFIQEGAWTLEMFKLFISSMNRKEYFK